MKGEGTGCHNLGRTQGANGTEEGLGASAGESPRCRVKEISKGEISKAGAWKETSVYRSSTVMTMQEGAGLAIQ